MKRVFLFLLTVILMLSAASVQANTQVAGLVSPYVVIIDDEIDLLTDEEESELIEQMMPITQYGTVIFRTINQRYFADQDLARSYLDFHVSNDRHFSCASLHINMGTRQIWLEASGKLKNIIGQSNANSITADIANQITKGNYYAGASKAFQRIHSLAEGNRDISTMRIICSILTAAALALMISIRIVYGKGGKKDFDGLIPMIPIAAASINGMEVLRETIVHQSKTSKSSGSSCTSCGSSCGSSCGGGSSCSSCSSGGGSGF